jgi:hypothetical protein
MGVGALASPRYAPAGLLIEHVHRPGRQVRVMIDGGPGASPSGVLDAWLTTDEAGELMPAIRRLAKTRGLTPGIGPFRKDCVAISCKAVQHTNHPSYGCLIRFCERRVVWAPEFFAFPRWARNADLMFAEAAAWDRPIRFAGGAGGHMPALAVALAARRAGVKRLVFAHIGRPTLRAMERGDRPPFGEFARDGQLFLLASDPRRPCWQGRAY